MTLIIGGMLWDENNKRIRIIDTDFFLKLNDITEQQSYNNNIGEFYSELQMELGLLNGQDTQLLSFLQENAEYSKLEHTLLLESFLSKEYTVSVTDLIKKAVEIFEQKFSIRVKNFGEMEQILNNRRYKGKREHFIDRLFIDNDGNNMAKLEEFLNNQNKQNENHIEHDER